MANSHLTIPQAEERPEILTLKLNNCSETTRRNQIEARMRHCRRSIQIARQESRNALADLAALLPAGPDRDLIRRATTEQLAVALGLAISEAQQTEIVRSMASHLQPK